MGIKKETESEIERNVTVTTDGKDIATTPEELDALLDDLIVVDNVNFSLAVSRAPKQFDSNKYFLSMSLPTGDAYKVKYSGSREDLRRAIGKKIVSKVSKGFSNLKSMLKAEFKKDGMDISHLGEFE